MAPKLTQAQKDVFGLYRRGLRALRNKPEPAQPAFLLYLRHAFRSPAPGCGGSLRKRDFAAIEYMLRRGNKMIESLYEEKGVKNIGLPGGALEWWREEVDKSQGSARNPSNAEK